MVHEYQVTGMTCTGCATKVKSALLLVDHVTDVTVSKADHAATITMDQHIPLTDLQQALDSKYQIAALHHNETLEQTKSWLEAYKPILLIFAYIAVATLLIHAGHHHFDVMQWMRHFMAAFFLVFSFFKMLHLKGFAESYVMYDIIAKKIPAWAYCYAFIELALGIAFLISFNAFVTNLITVVIMTVSIIGVLQTVWNKRKIQCACLGVVFNLPMSTVTIIEDGLMIAMSVAMLLMM